MTILSLSTSSKVDWALGLYTLEGPDVEGNPVWRLGDQEWFIYYREEMWRVGDKSDNGWLRSEKTETDMIPETSWEYFKAGWWYSSAGITVKGE